MTIQNFFNEPTALALLLDDEDVEDEVLALCNYIVVNLNAAGSTAFKRVVERVRNLKRGCVKSLILEAGESVEDRGALENIAGLLNSGAVVDWWVLVRRELREEEISKLMDFLRPLAIDNEYKFIVGKASNFLSYDTVNSNLVRVLVVGDRYPQKGVLRYRASSQTIHFSDSLIEEGCELDDPDGVIRDLKKRKNFVNFEALSAGYPDYRRVYFNSIVVEFTRNCNSACLHCYIGSNPGKKEKLSRDEVIGVVEELSDLDERILPFRRFCIAGGEVTLPEYLSDVIEILSFAKKKGFFTEIVTNGFIFAEGEDLNGLLRVLDGMEVSVSPFHIEALGTDYYRRVLTALKLPRVMGKSVVLRYQTTKRYTLKHLFDIFQRELAGYVVVSSPVSRIGRAKSTIGKKELWNVKVKQIRGGCWKNLNITVTSTGHITPCCAGSEITTFLKYGNIRRESAVDVVKRMADDPYLYILTRYPEKIIEVLQDELPGEASCFCELCVLINSDRRLYGKVTEFVRKTLEEARLCDA